MYLCEIPWYTARIHCTQSLLSNFSFVRGLFQVWLVTIQDKKTKSTSHSAQALELSPPPPPLMFGFLGLKCWSPLDKLQFLLGK